MNNRQNVKADVCFKRKEQKRRILWLTTSAKHDRGFFFFLSTEYFLYRVFRYAVACSGTESH